jgi:hypothetical protein
MCGLRNGLGSRWLYGGGGSRLILFGAGSVGIRSGHVGGTGGCADGVWAEADRLLELGGSHAVFLSLHYISH